MALMLPLTGSAAMHALLVRVSLARDAYEVFGWTAASVFTLAEMRARTAAFLQDIGYVPRLPIWRMMTPAERQAARAVVMAAYVRWRWAMPIVAAREQVMDDQSDEETDADA
jgi:hypothetical protein